MTTSKHYPEGILGKKLGMTQVFTAEGQSIPVTIIQAGPCYVLNVRGKEEHGYTAVQFGFEPKKNQRCNKAELGQFKKAGQGAFYHVKEVRCDAESLGWNEVGKEVTVSDVFKDGETVDISGVSIGRGFQGVGQRQRRSAKTYLRCERRTDIDYQEINLPSVVAKAIGCGCVNRTSDLSGDSD